MGIQLSKIVCWRDSFPHWVLLTSLLRNSVRVGLFLGVLFCSVSLYASTVMFNYCSFIIYFEIRKCAAAKFILFWDCFGYLAGVTWSMRCLMCVSEAVRTVQRFALHRCTDVILFSFVLEAQVFLQYYFPSNWEVALTFFRCRSFHSEFS